MPRRPSKLMFFLPGVVAIVVAVLAALGYLGDRAYKDWQARRPALAAARARFAPLQAVMAQRLAQPHPMEFGQVWITHSGRICGLVNGEGAFDGHPGMTAFYSDAAPLYYYDGVTAFHAGGAQVHFGPDSQTDQFAGQWMACNQDVWGIITPGSAEEGPCGTRARMGCRERKS